LAEIIFTESNDPELSKLVDSSNSDTGGLAAGKIGTNIYNVKINILYAQAAGGVKLLKNCSLLAYASLNLSDSTLAYLGLSKASLKIR
jgi:hypothetical protein